MDTERAINLAMFPVYEAVRLWARENKLEAPFEKISARLVDETTEALKPYFLKVRKALGICQIEIPVDLNRICQRIPDYALYASAAETSLHAVAEQVGFRNEQLDEFVRRLPSADPPCNHLFGDLVKVDGSGARWEVWFRSKYGSSQVVVVVSRDGVVLRECVVAAKDGPLYLEDDFPLKKTRLSADGFSILDRKGHVLASVAPAAELH